MDPPPPPPPAVVNRSINDLPDELLLHILSFFPTLDAVQTSLLSRKWRPLWLRLRLLKFSYEDFPPNDPPSSDNRDFFASFVDRALILRPHTPHLDLFSLSLIYNDRLGFHVDSWIRCAVIHLKARELHLDFFIHRDYHRDDHRYDFPFAVLRSGNVASLTLIRADLTLPASLSAIGVVSLASLCLDQVYLPDQMLADVIAGCPNLEELELRDIWGMEKMKIRSKKMKKLALCFLYDMENSNTVEIDCPNLVSIRFESCGFSHFVLKMAPALVRFYLNIMRIRDDKDYELWCRTVRLLEQAPYVKHLDLQNWWFKLFTWKDSFPKSFMLHDLNHLELCTGYTQLELAGLAALLEISPNLQSVNLYYINMNEKYDTLPEEFSNKLEEFNMPSLKQVTMRLYTGSEDEINFISILKKYALVLEKIVIHHVQVGEKSFAPVVLNRTPCK